MNEMVLDVSKTMVIVINKNKLLRKGFSKTVQMVLKIMNSLNGLGCFIKMLCLVYFKIITT